MGLFSRWKKPKEQTFFKFFISEDGESIDYEFETFDLDKFLKMMAILLSGSISEEIIDCIFKEINDDKIKDSFVNDLLNRIDESLSKRGEDLVVNPSEFNL